MPALDYLLNEVSAKDRAQFAGLFKLMATDGPQAFNSKVFKQFIGEDAKDGMAEFIRKQDRGHRILCFRMHDTSGNRTILLACGFIKPGQRETPPEHKRKAREILESHRRRTNKRK